jgi:uncharacterized damage-inducible protein DinB
MVELLRAEIDREAQRTRVVLEQVPRGKDDFVPHPKSMPLGRLAGLVAAMFSWVGMIIEQEELNLTPPAGQGQYQQPAMDQLVATLERNVANAHAALAKTTDDVLLNTNWKLLAGGQVVMNQPRHIVLRETLNHLAHHRGQLTVYLRLTGQKVPAVYGPSADDQTFR